MMQNISGRCLITSEIVCVCVCVCVCWYTMPSLNVGLEGKKRAGKGRLAFGIQVKP